MEAFTPVMMVDMVSTVVMPSRDQVDQFIVDVLCKVMKL